MELIPKKRVKIPCNHFLHFTTLNFSESLDNTCLGCGIADQDYSYTCFTCKFRAHVECIEWPETINHPNHSRHPLKKVSWEEIAAYTDGKCHFCRLNLIDPIYHCSLCNFSIEMKCWWKPPQGTICQPKSHEHILTLLPRKDNFTCNACGMVGHRNPYVCNECGFMLHRGCIDLPRVININRHDHRVSRTYHLGYGDWDSCGVCRKEMDWSFGGFICKHCPHYAVHSMCGITKDVWDGKELEDVPEEEEIEEPYKKVNDKEIIHFAHQHNLVLGDDHDDEKIWCNACCFPINSDPFFKCGENCKFFLHKECANLPRKKRSIFHVEKLALEVDYKENKYHKCTYCGRYFDGFRYKAHVDEVDVHCSLIDEPYHHELHPHPLYHLFAAKDGNKLCGGCGKSKSAQYVLSCTVCEFNLGMECATLPRKVKHICDTHELSLHHGDDGNSNGPLWCDICEKKTDPRVWFYGCDDCGTTLHIKCVVGDMYNLKPWNKYFLGAELVVNDGMTRPVCSLCNKRCMFSSFLKYVLSGSSVRFACSVYCLFRVES